MTKLSQLFPADAAVSSTWVPLFAMEALLWLEALLAGGPLTVLNAYISALAESLLCRP